MDDGEEEPSRGPWWVREDRELSVEAHARQTGSGEQKIGRYLRTITQKAITFTCALCGADSQREQYPGPRPRYCSDACRGRAAAETAAARMRRMRARRGMPSSPP